MVKVLFDIDGVLNPFLADASRLPPSFVPVQEGWASWLLDFNQHRQWMLQLEREAELVWASSWEEESNLVNKRFGLDGLTYPHVPFKNAPSGEGMWKLPAIERYLAQSDEAVVWLDDEFEDDAREWAARRPSTLLIECDPTMGWTEAQYEQVLDFVRSHPKVLREESSPARLGVFRFPKPRKKP
jgi:hypothetical protein